MKSVYLYHRMVKYVVGTHTWEMYQLSILEKNKIVPGRDPRNINLVIFKQEPRPVEYFKHTNHRKGRKQ